MRLFDLFEKNLPLKRGVNAWGKSMYGAFICVMKPEDFIRLTTSDQEEYEKIFKDKFSNLADYSTGKDEKYNKNMYNMPFLYINHETGKVTAHEGRHRAAMVAKEGGKSFPCLIIFEYPHLYEVTYKAEPLIYDENGYLDYDYDNAYTDQKIFKSRDEAESFEKQLRLKNEVEKPKIFYSKIEIDIIFRGKMKGSPRSDPEKWKYDAWKNEDMVPQLVGQYDNSIRIPTSSMRYGPLKGHTHFKS